MQTSVYEALDEAWEIRKQVTHLAAVKEKAALRSIGLEIESDSDSECREEDTISDSEWISVSGESDSSDTESYTPGTNTGRTKPEENIVEITSDKSDVAAVKSLGSYSTLLKTLSVQAYAPDNSELLAMLRKKQTELVCFCP